MSEERKIGAREYIILGVLCLLLVFSGVQAFQVDKIQEQMQEMEGNAPATGSTGAASSPPPQTQMVGGC